MREIKFRAWDKYRNQLYICDDIYFAQEPLNEAFKLDEFAFMQYTGLKDCDNKEIYEGDIILFRDIKHKVVFIDQHNNDGYTLNPTMLFFGLELEPSKQNREDKLLYVQTFDWDDQEYYKVIGNIYEDSHLLDNSKDKRENK